MYNNEKFTNILIKYQITPNQFYILYSLFKKDWDSLFKYVNKVVVGINEEGRKKTGFSIEEELQPLVEKGLIVNLGNHKFEVLDLCLTNEFIENLFIDSEEAGIELFNAYPHWLIVNGSKVIAKSCDKDAYMLKYAKKINNDLVLHKSIIEDVKLANEQSLINFKISNFIDGELWTSLAEEVKKKSNFTKQV